MGRRVRGARRQDNRKERRGARRTGEPRAKPTRYRMQQKIVAFGDDFTIENDAGQAVFQVDGKMLRVRDTLFFRDMQGNELCKIQERIARVKDTMKIEGPRGETLGVVKKALITPLRERWLVKIGDGPDLEVQGSVLDHEYNIGEGPNLVAEVSKKWFRIRDTYGVSIKPGQNDILILAVTVAVDMMAHPGR
ncbi:MAG: LURP-one-related family protein [Anaerolineae bacterium]